MARTLGTPTSDSDDVDDVDGGGEGEIAPDRTGLVVSGGAGRGPYQAGAIAELLPTLIREGHRPTVLFGTSSGALNVALLAQFAHHGAGAGELIVEVWSKVGHPFRNTWTTLPSTGLRLGLRLLGVPGVTPVKGLLDSAPLRRYATAQFRPAQVAANVEAGAIETVGVAATFCPPRQAAARTRLFVQGRPPASPPGQAAIDIVPTDLRVEHLLASAAIPTLFPPVTIMDPDEARGDYIDGGVRLNAPMQAILSMGVSRLVVVSGHSMCDRWLHRPQLVGRGPDLAGSLAVSLRAALTDGLTDDLLRLGQEHPDLPYVFVAPEDGELAALAADSYRQRGWRPFDTYWPIRRLLAAAGDDIGPDELLSLVLFDEGYSRDQVELGRAHARAALKAGWQTGPPRAPGCDPRASTIGTGHR